jgi:hypothetical protein
MLLRNTNRMAKLQAPNSESAFDRFLRFGAALFAVPKDELPKRTKRQKAAPKKRAKPDPK